jgi:oxepin-CoA hydrolase/3-oxo-5,6-dehydrosuberyl-CoA semialdehyde dehydrogenase
MINISDRNTLRTILNQLRPDIKALWGRMSPQHAIEHLIITLQISSGKKIVVQATTQEEAEVIKSRLIYSDMSIPQGIINPLLGEDLAALKYKSLEEALQQFEVELDDFEKYYTENPDAKQIQPRMGLLKHNEWIIFHNKHFTHHLKQFGLDA